MKCTKCGHANRAGVQFCEECGTQLTKAFPPVPARKDDVACPKCGTKNRVGVQFCEECGTPLQKAPPPMPARKEDVVCPKCGTKNRAGVQFCENCGQSFAIKPSKLEKTKAKNPRKPGKLFQAIKANPARSVLIVLLLIGVVLGGLWGYDKLTNAVDPWQARGMADGVVSAMYPELYKIQPKINSFTQDGHPMKSYIYSTQIEITMADGTKTQATVGVIVNVDRKTGELKIILTQ
jgi:DNA-directed RNA polymerase subunit RPC12/RpoP